MSRGKARVSQSNALWICVANVPGFLHQSQVLILAGRFQVFGLALSNCTICLSISLIKGLLTTSRLAWATRTLPFIHPSIHPTCTFSFTLSLSGDPGLVAGDNGSWQDSHYSRGVITHSEIMCGNMWHSFCRGRQNDTVHWKKRLILPVLFHYYCDTVMCVHVRSEFNYLCERLHTTSMQRCEYM